MSTAIEKATLYVPIALSSLIFAFRRTNKGLDAMQENPLYGTSNIMIAGGQTLKGLRATEDLTYSYENTSSAAESIKSMNSTVKTASETNKFLKVTKNIFNFVSKYINPLICVAEGIKVISSDDKADAAVRGVLGLGCMFTFEKYAKKYMGMPYMTIHKNGTRETVKREALYHKNPFVEKQVNAMKDYCMTKQALKSVPGAAKALLFVAASISGCKVGNTFANILIGKEKEKKAQKNNNPFVQEQIAYSNAA